MERLLRIFFSTILFIVILSPIQVFSLSFEHKSAIYTEITTGMRKATTTVYTNFPKANDIKDYIRAEYIDQTTFSGRERFLNLTKDGFMHRVNLDNGQCTKTDIREATKGFYKGNDQEAFSKEMQRGLGLNKVGTCNAAGLTGEHLKSDLMEMCIYKNVIPLWQKTMGSESKITHIELDVTLPKDKINLPKNTECTIGVDIQNIMKKMQGQSSSYPERTPDSTDRPYDQKRQIPQDVPNMKESMKKANEAMKMLEKMLMKQ